ncbi:MAG: methyltransferase domain-containing protein [Deltaproteobacteria bacterium]|nr:MAG: methyltransferase domain-containing protein [Deltaproteobacteria bacterium]
MPSSDDRVRGFYEKSPFPGYPPRDSLSALRARAARSEFARLLDDAIPPDALVLEIGCGTGQLSLFLASSGRTVVGADFARPSLRLARDAAALVIRRRDLLRRSSSHAGSARLVRVGRASGPARRRAGDRPLQRVCATAPSRAPRRRSPFRFSLDPLGPGAARSPRRARPSRSVVALSVPTSRRAPAHAARSAALVP